jgi:hypothetical protein
VFVWGFYQDEVIMQPRKLKVGAKFLSISQSFSGLTGAIDTQNRVWAWHQKDNNLTFSGTPKLVPTLRLRLARHIFVGNNSLFALGNDIETVHLKTTNS